MYSQINYYTMNSNRCSIIHSDGEIIDINSDFLKLIDCNQDDLIGTDIYAYILSEDRNKLRNQIKEINNAEDRTLGMETKILDSNDNQHHVIIVNSKISSTDNFETMFIKIDSEINNYTRTLKEKSMDEAPLGITIADIKAEDEPIIYANKGFTDITGYSLDDILGQNHRFLQGKNTSEKQIRQLRKSIDNRNICRVNLRNYRKNGTEFWNRVTIKPLMNNNNNEVTHYVGFQEDITESKSYRREKNILGKHVAMSKNAMLVLDENWNIEYVNPAFENITGYSKKEVLGESIHILQPNEEFNFVYEDINSHILQGESWEGVLNNTKKSGEFYRAEQTVTPLFDKHGELINITVIQSDITQDRINKQVMDVLNRILRHNLRTSINVIDGYAGNLDSDDYGQSRIALNAISDRTEEMKRISNKITKVRELLGNKDSSNKFSIGKIKEIIKNYQKENELNIEYNSDECDNLKVRYGRLFQLAIGELLENSIDKNPEGSNVEINIKRLTKNMIRLEFIDEGKTYSIEKWNIIKSEEETPLKHTDGIGLWIVYWCIMAIGGRIRLIDCNDNETKFILDIPVE